MVAQSTLASTVKYRWASWMYTICPVTLRGIQGKGLLVFPTSPMKAWG